MTKYTIDILDPVREAGALAALNDYNATAAVPLADVAEYLQFVIDFASDSWAKQFPAVATHQDTLTLQSFADAAKLAGVPGADEALAIIAKLEAEKIVKANSLTESQLAGNLTNANF